MLVGEAALQAQGELCGLWSQLLHLAAAFFFMSQEPWAGPAPSQPADASTAS